MITMMRFARKTHNVQMSLRAYLRMNPVPRDMASPKLLKITGATV